MVYRHVMKCTKPPKHAKRRESVSTVTIQQNTLATKNIPTSPNKHGLSFQTTYNLHNSAAILSHTFREQLSYLPSLCDTSRSQSDSLDSSCQSPRSSSSDSFQIVITSKSLTNKTSPANGNGDELSCEKQHLRDYKTTDHLSSSGPPTEMSIPISVSSTSLYKRDDTSENAIHSERPQKEISTTSEKEESRLIDAPIIPVRSGRVRNASRYRTYHDFDTRGDDMACPICQKPFSRLGFFDESEFEKNITSHMVTCSAKEQTKKSLVTPPQISCSSSSQNTWETKSVQKRERKISKYTANKRARKLAPQLPLVVAVKSVGLKPQSGTTQPVQLSVTTKPEECKSSLSSQRSLETSTIDSDSIQLESQKSASTVPRTENTNDARVAPKKEKKGTVVVDSGHFLAQTWWREPIKRGKRVASSAKFDLRQCLILDEPAPAPTQQSTRESKRLRKQSTATLKLCCPICRKVFSDGMLGSLTEEAMGRHVEKCTKRRFEDGNFMINNKSGPEPMFLKDSRETLTQNFDGRVELSEEEKKLQQQVHESRAARIQSILFMRRKSRKTVAAFMSKMHEF